MVAPPLNKSEKDELKLIFLNSQFYDNISKIICSKHNFRLI